MGVLLERQPIYCALIVRQSPVSRNQSVAHNRHRPICAQYRTRQAPGRNANLHRPNTSFSVCDRAMAAHPDRF
jgi:hypothetical protein